MASPRLASLHLYIDLARLPRGPRGCGYKHLTHWETRGLNFPSQEQEGARVSAVPVSDTLCPDTSPSTLLSVSR